jgi:hypothetical protein
LAKSSWSTSEVKKWNRYDFFKKISGQTISTLNIKHYTIYDIIKKN